MATILNASGRHSLHKDTEATYSVIATCVGVPCEQLTADMSLVEDLGIDSIDLLAIVVGLEEEFGVVIPDESLLDILTVGDAVSCVASARELRPAANESGTRNPANPCRRRTELTKTERTDKNRLSETM